MNNRWNKLIYKLWSPIYDTFFNSGSFLKVRKEMLTGISSDGQKKILFVGVGTGADLEYLDTAKFEITAIDYSPDMLEVAKKKYGHTPIQFLEMDAQNMVFADETFDYVVASLILTVVPDAEKCFSEINRVLKKDGKIYIFDKFVPANKQLSFVQKLARPIISLFGTDIGLRFENLYENYHENLHIEADVPVMFNGIYRKIIIRKLG